MPALYQPIPALPVIARVPLLPVARAIEMYRTASPEDCARALLRRNPVCDAAIWLASPALSSAMRDPSADASVWNSAARYVVRMASRCTPFGLFSGVAAVETGAATTLRLVAASRRAYARIDRGVMAKLSDAVELAPIARSSLMVYANDYAVQRAGASYVFSCSRTTPSLRRQAVEPTELVRDVRERARHGIRAGALRDALIAETGLSSELAEATISALLEAGVLVSELPAHVFRFEDDEALASWARSSPAAAASVGEIRDALAAVNETPAERHGVAAYEHLDAVINRAFEVEKNRFQLDSCVVLSGTLGHRVLEDVSGLAELILRSGLSSRRSDAVAKFVEAFEGEALVPLMQLAGTGLLQSIVEVSRPPVHAYTDEGHVTLLADIADAIASGTEVRYSHAEFAALLKPAERSDFPESVEVAFELAADDEQAIERGDYLIAPAAFGVSQNAARSTGRFLHLLPAEAGALRAWHRADHGPDVRAELLFRPPQANLGSVLASCSVVSHRIEIGVHSAEAGAHRIGPQDLCVGVEAGAFFLWSQSLRRRVQVQRHDMVSVGHLGADVVTFLAMTAAMAPRSTAKLALGDADLLPYVPRIVVGERIVLSPARWRLGAKMRTPEEVQRWRTRHRVPRLVRVVENVDHTMLIDLESDRGREQLLRAVARSTRSGHGPLLLEEALGTSRAWLSDGGEPHAAEFVASLQRARPREVIVRRAGTTVAEVSAEERWRGVDRGWLYFKLYGEREDQDRVLVHVLRPLRDQLVRECGAQRWFFLRYEDPRPHLRFRAAVPRDDANRCAGMVWHALLEHVRAGWLRDVEQAVYHPEVARYGGAAGLNLAEELFALDSAQVLETLASRPSEGARRSAAVRQAAELLEAVLETDDLERWLAQPRRRQKLAQSDWQIIREVKAELLDGAPGSGTEVRERLSAALPGDDRAADRVHFADSVVHMHFNRSGFSRHDEHALREMLWHVRQGLAARRRTERREEVLT